MPAQSFSNSAPGDSRGSEGLVIRSRDLHKAGLLASHSGILLLHSTDGLAELSGVSES